MDEARFLDLLSGRSRGFGPTLQRAGLSLLSLGYGVGVGLNGLAYRLGLKRVHAADVPVVSVGNVTTGGTGKTPFVAHVVRTLQGEERSPAILSRGYRADETGVNDELRVLANLCPGVPHVQGRDRVASAEIAVREHGADVLVLDDGFQHRRLARDLDIVLVDAVRPWGYGHLLPRGLLRERLRALTRADLVVVTRVDQADEAAITGIDECVTRYRGRPPEMTVAFPPTTLVDAAGNEVDLAEHSGRAVGAFCGIGNPAAFRASLESRGLPVVAFRAFPDHHHFTAGDLETITVEARAAGAEAVVCTEKDLVKIDRADLDGLPLHAVRIGVEVQRGGDSLAVALRRLGGMEDQLPASSS